MSRDNNTRKRAEWKQLTEKERYKIEVLLQQGLTAREIGSALNRNRRTIEQEVKRGSVIQRDSELRERLVYAADAGQCVHEERASNKGRGLKIGHDHKLADYIEQKIKECK